MFDFELSLLLVPVVGDCFSLELGGWSKVEGGGAVTS